MKIWTGPWKFLMDLRLLWYISCIVSRLRLIQSGHRSRAWRDHMPRCASIPRRCVHCYLQGYLALEVGSAQSMDGNTASNQLAIGNVRQELTLILQCFSTWRSTFILLVRRIHHVSGIKASDVHLLSMVYQYTMSIPCEMDWQGQALNRESICAYMYEPNLETLR